MAEAELDLLERVLLSILKADNEEAFSEVTQKFLAPVIHKSATTQYPQVRQRAIEILQRLSKRIKASESIKLPGSTLGDLLLRNIGNTSVYRLSFMYVKLALERSITEERDPVVAKLLCCVSPDHLELNYRLLCIVSPWLGDWAKNRKRSLINENDRVTLEFLKAEQLQCFLEFIQDTFVLIPWSDRESDCPPGLSKFKHDIMVESGIAKADILREIKMELVPFLEMTMLKREQVVIPLLLAQEDGFHRINEAANFALKKLDFPYNDAGIVKRMYRMYLGERDLNDIEEDQRRSPINMKVKASFLATLSKSKIVARDEFFPDWLRIAFDGVNDENARMHKSALSFFWVVCQLCEEAMYRKIAVVLLNGILKKMETLKQRVEAHEVKNALPIAYNVLSTLCDRSPELFSHNFDVLKTLFSDLTFTNLELRQNAQQCLLNVANAVRKLAKPKGETGDIYDLLEAYMDDNRIISRIMAVQVADVIFDGESRTFRLLCLRALGDDADDVQAAGAKALGLKPKTKFKPYDEWDVNKRHPKFEAMVGFMSDLMAERKTKNEFLVTDKGAVVYMHFGTYSAFLRYANHLMELGFESGKNIPKEATDRYLMMLEEVCSSMVRYDAIFGALQGIESMVCHQPGIATSRYGKDLKWLISFISSTDLTVRNASSRLIAIIATQLPKEDTWSLFTDLSERMVKARMGEELFGLVICCSMLASRIVALQGVDPADKAVLDVVAFIIQQSIQIDIEHTADKYLIVCLEAMCYLLASGLAARYITSERNIGETKIDMSGLLSTVGKYRNHPNHEVVKQAIKAVGSVGFFRLDNPNRTVALNYMVTLAKQKNDELMQSGGEAICALLYRCHGQVYPDIRKLFADVKPLDAVADALGEADTEVFHKFTATFQGMITGSSAVQRRSAGYWLMSLVSFAGDVEASRQMVLHRAREIQAGFCSLLVEKDESLNETASSGIAILFDMCRDDVKIRNNLVDDLKEILLNGKAPSQIINADTPVFGKNELGKQPDGGNLSTYKELCSLASDMNQPDLIYKFMALSSHQSQWSSRMGAATGLANIANVSAADLEAMLPTLVPKLYRYKFDPDTNVAMSMRNMWKKVVKDPAKTMDKYFRRIMFEVLGGLESGQWRVREASCNAVPDLFMGRTGSEVLDTLEDFWIALFRVMDDMKESVRKAAETAAKSFRNMCVRLCDATYSEKASECLEIVIRILLERGITNSSTEVKVTSIKLLLDICKLGGRALSNHLASIIPKVLELLTSLEPAQLNYASFHTEKLGVTQEQLDAARVAGSRVSPLNEIIDYALRTVNKDNCKDVIAAINSVIRVSPGMNTKVAGANAISRIITKDHHMFKENAGKTRAVLTAGLLNDRNMTVRKTYANVLVSVLDSLDDFKAEETIKKLCDAVLKADVTRETEVAIAYFFKELANGAGDLVRNSREDVTPVMYIGRHHADETISKLYKEAWNETMPGVSSAVAGSLTTIISLLLETLESSSWPRKKQGAMAVEELAGLDNLEISDQDLEKIMFAVKANIKGRIWPGKESLLRALSSTVKSRPQSPVVQSHRDVVIEVLLQSAARKDLQFKRIAYQGLYDVVDKLHWDLWDVVKVQLQADREEHLAELFGEERKIEDEDDEDEGKGESMDGVSRKSGIKETASSDDATKVKDTNEKKDGEKDVKRKKIKDLKDLDDVSMPHLLAFEAVYFKTMTLCWIHAKGEDAPSDYTLIFELLQKAQTHATWNVKLALLESFGLLLTQVPEAAFWPEVDASVLDWIQPFLYDQKHLAVRQQSIARLDDFLNLRQPSIEQTFPKAVQIQLKELIRIAEGRSNKEADMPLRSRFRQLFTRLTALDGKFPKPQPKKNRRNGVTNGAADTEVAAENDDGETMDVDEVEETA
eukprot:Clim_evm58s150 gene=Clim_evmTU58s150